MKNPIHLVLVLLAVAGLCVSCDDSAPPSDPRWYHHSFRLDTDSGHAKAYYIQVSLPRSYYRQTEKIYPVIYLTDADDCFGMARDLATVLDRPQREAIVVGIGYGSPEKLNELRWKEYGDAPDRFGSPGWAQLFRFMRNRLIPYVETKYRVNPFNRTLFGWSSGARFATSVLAADSATFHNYIIGGYGRDSSYVESLRRARPILPVNVYFGVGDRDPRFPEALDFARMLSGTPLPGLQFTRDVYPGFGNESATIAVLLDRGMSWVYGRKPIEPRLRAAMLRGGAARAVAEYARLSVTNPDDFAFDPDHLLGFAATLEAEGDSLSPAVFRDYVRREYPTCRITVRIEPERSPAAGVVFITGNHPALGDWDPRAVQMGQPKKGVWSHAFTVRKGTALEYTVTQGSWSTRATDSTGTIYPRYDLVADRDTTVSHVVQGWSRQR